METLLNRYRNITVLLVVVFAQLVLLAWQVKTHKDVRLIRVWAVTAVTPIAKVLETVRSGTTGFFGNYIMVRDARSENRRLQQELNDLKMANHHLRSELETADRVKALTAFQARTPSKTLAARVIATGAGTNSKVLFVDRGTVSGVQKGMAVVTPEGIVGKVLAAYPTAAQIMLITDPEFAAGVVSQKNHVRGTLKGQGHVLCKVDYIANEESVDAGEMFFTSGDDRIFPKGFPVGLARLVKPGTQGKDVQVEPSGMMHGVEEVLILIQGVHESIPDAPSPTPGPIYMTPPVPGEPQVQPPAGAAPAMQTDADRLREHYKGIGEGQGHVFGEGTPGSRPPDFNQKPGAAKGQRAPQQLEGPQPPAGQL